MPAGDRTGPTGFGPMTGRALGNCTGVDTRGNMNSVGGRGLGGFGRGTGRGFGRGFGRGAAVNRPYYGESVSAQSQNVPQMTSEQEVEMLMRRAEELGQTLNEINARIKKLGKEKPVGEK